MLLELNSEQEFLHRTTARFLEEHASAAEVRRLLHEPAGYRSQYWQQGAELGWTSLLVAEADGGVAVSASGLMDLTLVAYEFGKRAAPGPLLSANVSAAALSAAGGFSEEIGGLLDGSALGTWCYSEGPVNGGLGSVGLEISLQGDEVVLNGVKRPVESADTATHLLVTGRTGAGLSQVWLPKATKGVTVSSLQSVDLTKRFSAVRFENVRLPLSAVVGKLGEADAAVELQLQQALVILNAEAVGAMQRGFDMTVEWAFDRYSFGRPLASYQALKHRFANMAMWLEASHAIADEAAQAVADGAANAGEMVSAAKAYIGDHAPELLQEAVQLHGGIGVTFEHDVHLFLRRVTLACALLGTPHEHRRRIAAFVAQREGK